MSVTIQTFANGDTDYVSKLNNNFNNTKVAVDALQALGAAAAAASLNPGSVFAGIFGTSGATLIGEASYLSTGASATLTVAAGNAWIPSLNAVVTLASPASLNFTGQPADTYYVKVDSSGNPSRETSSTEALYSVVWTGSAFGTITRIAKIFWNITDMTAALTSAALAVTYGSLDLRLEAGEAAAVATTAEVVAARNSVAHGAYGSLDLRLEAIDTAVADPELVAIAGLTSAADKIPYFTGSGTAALLTRDTDVNLAADSDTVVATQKAVKAYVDAAVTGGASDVMIFKGVIDCSADPNYPAADAGNLYKISVAGKIGGASGTDVEIGDTIYCITDATSAGTQAAVGANWVIAQVNTNGAVTGPVSATDSYLALFDGTTGSIIKVGSAPPTGTNTGDETTTTAGALINGATGKTTPVDADYIGLMDSAASNILKKVSWANVKATLKTYFDTLYAPLSQPFDVHAFYPGIPTASAKVVRIPVARSVTFPDDFAGSYGVASATATASTAFDVQKNGSSVGTITFALGASTSTFVTAAGALSLAAGDVLTIVAPATPDATLADVGFALAGTR